MSLSFICEYGSALLYSLPNNQISRLQRLQNTAARIVILSRKSCSITSILKQLHWLPISQRIIFKLMLIVHTTLNGKAPHYCFKFKLHYRIFYQVPCFSSLNPSLDTHGVTYLFLQLRPASGTLLLNQILDLVFVPQHLNLFSKLILCHKFSRTNLVVSVFLCFVFVLILVFTALWPPSKVDMCALHVLLVVVVVDVALYL